MPTANNPPQAKLSAKDFLAIEAIFQDSPSIQSQSKKRVSDSEGQSTVEQIFISIARSLLSLIRERHASSIHRFQVVKLGNQLKQRASNHYFGSIRLLVIVLPLI
ncbi:hypothetical protein G7Y89_g2170 [Cudoniella acicularis]|uniref:Uncharacterized protein n=1 Tax=Cudoniella acicularis TaxID=354080 RepID=A0A8H4W9L1_9HELO|nr:hypothetical protein G7Y89_g2170 [Cudoniella acicularis]